ncbi:hypothetical protein MNEG_9855 [Monoraphidium neglectum]|uniref:Coenzyme Q-binding protein COQ10 START domain-containing protein n=1 Tax=Monoraphidium neglectum TaxID=145388 RepID=A0A0D2KRB7_9CHLO|nr:hypothetical protein MNEG_9855 [Monoraphidium neglectum]KIY98108.1 hypothetical protein MNEG_9855 [Monoraphidium neglectum]|eukprot:XP_013897128.1 hypothetical protein MNEG_9855 [Monoraphidium neglectum]
MGTHTAVQEDLEVPTVEDWSEKDCKVVVRTTPGSNLLADLVLRAKVDASPDEVYAVLTNPDSHLIFRGIKATLERRTLEDSGKGRRKLFVHHQAATRFLWLQVTFSTQLLVEEDDRARTICFRNAKDGGFMRTFTGRWEVSPFCQDTLNRIYSPHDTQRHRGVHLGWLNPARALGAMQHRESDAAARECSLVTLEQALAPRLMPPGPLMRMVRGLCARTVSNMMADLQKEIERRREGESASGSKGVSGSNHLHGKAATHAACMSLSAGDLFANSAPLHITIEL